MAIALGVAKFVGLNGSTFRAACAITSRLRVASPALRLLAACVVALGIANASGLILGLLGLLAYWPLLATQACIAAMACVGARWKVMRAFLDPRPVAALFDGSTQRIALALLVVAYAYAIFLCLVSESFAGDELMYHLPIAAEYARSGGIAIPELGRFWGTRYWAYYPGGAYLLDQWFLLPFGTGVLVDMVQLPFALGTALSVYVLARAIGARGPDALWAALLFLAVPIVINQVKTALVDVMFSFAFTAGLAFLLVRPLSITAVVLAAVAWGAAPAIKLPGILYLPLGACVVGLLLFEQERDLGGLWQKLGGTGAALALGVTLFSGYWFARNAWLAGSVLYPLDLHAEPPVAWSNVIFFGLLFPLLDYAPNAPGVFNYETGAGPQFICLAVPALIAYGAASWRERRFGGIALAALPLVAYGVLLLRVSTLVPTLLRYVLPAMPIGFAAFSWLLSRIDGRPRMAGLALGCIAFSVLVAVPRIGTYTNAESLRNGLATLRRGEARTRFDVMGALDLQDYRRTWAYLDTLGDRHDIALSHVIFAYPTMGAQMQRRLQYIDETDPARWLAAIDARKVAHVAVAELVQSHTIFSLHGTTRFELDYDTARDEALLASRRTARRRVHALRLRYLCGNPTAARVVIGVNGFAATWELPRSAGAARTEVLPWRGDLRSVDVDLEFVARKQLRGRVSVALERLEVQEDDGQWVELPNGVADWQVRHWPLEYYWVEAHPERFKLVMRDNDFWGSRYSGELRLYEVVPQGVMGGQAQ